MPRYAHADYLDGGPDMLRARAATAGRIRLRVLGAYTLDANYAAVAAATLGYVALAAADITTAAGASSARDSTLAGKAITLTAGDDGVGLHWAITDETDSKVLLVAPGTSDVTPLLSGGVLTSPSFQLAHHPQPS